MIEFSKRCASENMESFFKILSFVPEDKLRWKPAPTAKSALEIAAHTAVTAGNFADFIREREVPGLDQLEDFIARTRAAEEAITSLDEMERVYRSNTDAVLAALDSLSEEDIELVLDSGVGFSMSMRWMMMLPAVHAAMHGSQLDYLQTCWGDMDVHF